MTWSSLCVSTICCCEVCVATSTLRSQSLAFNWWRRAAYSAAAAAAQIVRSDPSVTARLGPDDIARLFCYLARDSGKRAELERPWMSTAAIYGVSSEGNLYQS